MLEEQTEGKTFALTSSSLESSEAEVKDMEIFPGSLRELWNEWELRVMVLSSLSLQVILIVCGSRRKRARDNLVNFLVWLAYLTADWLATVSLGTLANNRGNGNASGTRNGQVLEALWAPFLLLHLGGPDTITAYSLEDNNLWPRHLLGLLVQVTVAFYIFLRSWTNTALTFIAIPVFVSGIIKYSERTWVLRSASTQQLEDTLLSAPTEQAWQNNTAGADRSGFVHRAHSLFALLKRLYANFSVRFAEGRRSHSFIIRDTQPWDYAFKLVEVELGFLFDVLYTKATVMYSLAGFIFRFVSFICTLSALIAFCIVVDKHNFSRIDILVTYVLFVGAVSLEIYAFISLIFSDWTTRWLTKNDSSFPNFIYSAISCCRSIFPYHNKRWSESIAQHSLVSFCLKNRATRCFGSGMLFNIYFLLELYWQRTWENVDRDNQQQQEAEPYHMKKLIFQQLQEKHEIYKRSGFDYSVLKKLLTHKGESVLIKAECFDEMGWSVEVEFAHSIFLWHIATDICFYCNPESHQDVNCNSSKKLSDYMFYLLLMRPHMLPKWIDRISHVRDTYQEAIHIFHRAEFEVKGRADACEHMLQLHTQSQPLELVRKEKSSKSVFFDGCRLAAQLQEVSNPWEMICQVWIEMLTYAASRCEWGAHAQQLRRGGELLTHVCLLMANLGLSEQFDIGRRGPKIESQNVGWGWGRSKVSAFYFAPSKFDQNVLAANHSNSPKSH